MKSEDLSEIIALATVAFLYYDPSHLNNRMCAPNKIWEYTNSEVPILANDLFALRQFKGLSMVSLKGGCFNSRLSIAEKIKIKVNQKVLG